MYFNIVTYFVLASIATGFASAQQLNRVAVAHLESQNVTGTVLFIETEEGLRVSGAITGLNEGDYGFHVHELGDTSTCYTTGAHFNPDATPHGGRNREHSERHVGDLGNVRFVGIGNGVSAFEFVDSAISLRGRNNILGRALVLHEREDDLGLTDHPDSLTTGNAGPRVACAVIGTHAPVEAWHYNSSFNVGPSIFLVSLLLIVSSFRF